MGAVGVSVGIVLADKTEKLLSLSLATEETWDDIES